MNKYTKAIEYAVLAAVFYGISSPASKVLLGEVPPMIMAAALYLGAGLGMVVLKFLGKSLHRKRQEQSMGRKELPYLLATVVLDIIAPISLMYGLKCTAASTVALLNNFEIVATALIALGLFHEKVSGRLWLAITLVVTSSIILSVDDWSSLHFSSGSLLVIVACLCWGLENNCARKVSVKDPIEFVMIKGFGSGCGAMCIAFCNGETVGNWTFLPLVLLLGFVSYGLSIYYYTYAQRVIGAAKTSAYYAFAPFVGVIVSIVFLGEPLTLRFCLAFVLMMLGAWLASVTNDGSAE